MERSNKNRIAIAILPFANMSSNEDIEYFSDGITEEIINALARIKQLKVTSRTSSFYYKGKHIPVRQIEKELRVSAILEGSIRLAAQTVRITAQLIHAEEDFHFWSESWDRKLENIFEIQDEISLQIADKLREQYGHFEFQDHLIEKKTDRIDAYEYALRARYHFNKWNPADARKAIDLYEKAIALDPKNTDSYIGLADVYSFFAVTELMPREEAWLKSREYTDIAYLLSPMNAGVHYLLANLSFFYDADFQEATKHTLKSIELKHNYPEAQHLMSLLYMISGRMEQASQHLEMAQSIDPLSQENLFYRAYFQYRNENFTEALMLFDECLDKNPHNIPAYIVRCYCLLKLEQYDKVLKFLDNMPMEIFIPHERLGIICLAHILNGDDERGQLYFAELKREAQNPTSFQAHSYLYLAYGCMNKANEAFNWLKEAAKFNSSVLLLGYADPLASKLKSDERYKQYLEKLYQCHTNLTKNIIEKTPLLNEETAVAYTEKLVSFINEEKPYLVPNLSLRSLASQLEIHPNKLSWLLNERMVKNFNEFINHYRIEYFKKLALDPGNSHISLIGLAYESGFNSKSVFNTYFKKETGMTPKEFLKKNTSS